MNVLDAHGTPLHTPTSGENRLAIVDALLEAGVDVNLVGAEYGETLLMESVYRVLLDAGANPASVDNWGRSPLHLVAAGAEVSALNERGETPVELAWLAGSSAVVDVTGHPKFHRSGHRKLHTSKGGR